MARRYTWAPENEEPRQGPLPGMTARPSKTLARDNCGATAKPAPDKVLPPQCCSSPKTSLPTRQTPAWRHADSRPTKKAPVWWLVDLREGPATAPAPASQPAWHCMPRQPARVSRQDEAVTDGTCFVAVPDKVGRHVSGAFNAFFPQHHR